MGATHSKAAGGRGNLRLPRRKQEETEGLRARKEPIRGQKGVLPPSSTPRKVTSPCITPCTCTRTQPRSPLPRSSRAAPTFRTEEKLPTSTGKHGARAGPGPRAAPKPCLSSAGSQIMPLHFRQSSLMGHTMLPNSFFFF